MSFSSIHFWFEDIIYLILALLERENRELRLKVKDEDGVCGIESDTERNEGSSREGWVVKGMDMEGRNRMNGGNNLELASALRGFAPIGCA